jgi:hypothetical protein
VTDGTLSPAGETDAYRFNGGEGATSSTHSASGNIFWRLVNPFGKLVFAAPTSPATWGS